MTLEEIKKKISDIDYRQQVCCDRIDEIQEELGNLHEEMNELIKAKWEIICPIKLDEEYLINNEPYRVVLAEDFGEDEAHIALARITKKGDLFKNPQIKHIYIDEDKLDDIHTTYGEEIIKISK